MPTQWRTIAPIVGRTATQCLERYQKLLDEAEARENDELGLGGPDGGETAAPSADDVRKLRYAKLRPQQYEINANVYRPGELDPDPESKPARPDTIDLDEDEKEMLSEARARLANTQGKKAKRKARERQLEESRRLAVLQKRRELKNAGINIKVVNRKKGQMDYNADIPFEKPAIPGFYDTTEENTRNERQREAFDPRKQQLANKRKGDPQDDLDKKRQKNDRGGPSATFAAAAKAGQMQRIREAEQSSKRRALVLPAPQVSEGELEDIVKMGMAGERASKMAGDEDDGARGLIGDYSSIVGATPIRTPRAPAQEDHIANEIRNIRALTETQSSLLGGENTPLHEGTGSTGFEGIAPRTQNMVTPNPMATPFRQGVNGVGATPMRTSSGPGATPMRTPRDHFSLNQDEGGHLVGSTPREIRMRENLIRNQLRQKLASLPKPKEMEWELEELPSETPEVDGNMELSEEDAAEVDRRAKAALDAAARAEFKRQTQVYQRGLPRPSNPDVTALLKDTTHAADSADVLVAKEMALLIANDARRHPLPGTQVKGSSPKLEKIDDELLENARAEIEREIDPESLQKWNENFEKSWASLQTSRALPGLAGYDDDDEIDEIQMMADAFSHVENKIVADAEKGNKLEKKLALHLGGYHQRAKTLRSKIVEAGEALEKAKIGLDTFRTLQVSEDGVIPARLEKLREEVSFVSRREREAQDLYRERKGELESLGQVNGFH
jgi:pre-mRNA-splicing factor CDC5/CEF1